MLYLNYKLYYKASAQSGTRWHRHTGWRGGMHMLVTGRMRLGDIGTLTCWCVDVGAFGVMAHGHCYDSNISPTYRGRPVGLRMSNSVR